MGDPVGIGPEIIAKAFAAGALTMPWWWAMWGRCAAGRGPPACPCRWPGWMPRDWARCPPACCRSGSRRVAAGAGSTALGAVDARAGAAAAACITGAVWLLAGRRLRW
jgi:4-hydroxythreonine-4-phosphate dehydrogenase